MHHSMPSSDRPASAFRRGLVYGLSLLLIWQRVASGLFQPLGVIVKDGLIYVSCRDQIVRLHDLNGDGESDWYENFNSEWTCD